MKKKNQYKMKTKHLITMMTILCLGLIVLSLSTSFSFAPVRHVLGYVIVPFQNGINEVGNWMTDQKNGFQSMKKLSAENEKLQKQVDELQIKNNQLVEDRYELSKLRELYDLDQEYSQYEKIGARVTGKDPGNWYSVFVVDKGSNDGIEVNMNVMAGSGLVGIVTKVGPNWSQVRSIIDDDSNVSGMVLSSSDNLMVNGDLKQMESGDILFGQLNDQNDKVAVGDKVVTSNISDRYLPGISIGYITSIEKDPNNLTKSGTITPEVDFQHIDVVLIIKQIKESNNQ